jgi:hypothetical protein
MKAQIRVKMSNWGRNWAIFCHPDEKKCCRGPRRVHGWRWTMAMKDRSCSTKGTFALSLLDLGANFSFSALDQ